MKLATFLDVVKARSSGSSAVNEASLNRVLQHVNDAKAESWAIVTPWKGGQDPALLERNKHNLQKLKSWLRSQGYGFFALRGHYEECKDKSHGYGNCPDDHRVPVSEPALFVPGITMDHVLKIVKEYDQDSLIYSGPDTGGQIVFANRDGTLVQGGTFHPGRISTYMSKVKGKPFTFEWVAQGWTDHLIEQAWLRYGMEFDQGRLFRSS